MFTKNLHSRIQQRSKKYPIKQFDITKSPKACGANVFICMACDSEIFHLNMNTQIECKDAHTHVLKPVYPSFFCGESDIRFDRVIELMLVVID